MHAGVGSAVLGRVTVGRNAWLGVLSVMRADGHFVRVGDDFHLGARSTLHINHEIFPCIVGDRVSVGRNACVHACTVGSDVVIGDDVVILDGAVVEDNVVLEAGSCVFPNKKVPGGFVYAGSPAKPVRPVEPGEGELVTLGGPGAAHDSARESGGRVPHLGPHRGARARVEVSEDSARAGLRVNVRPLPSAVCDEA